MGFHDVKSLIGARAEGLGRIERRGGQLGPGEKDLCKGEGTGEAVQEDVRIRNWRR